MGENIYNFFIFSFLQIFLEIVNISNLKNLFIKKKIIFEKKFGSSNKYQ